MGKPSEVSDSIPKRAIKLAGSVGFYTGNWVWCRLQQIAGKRVPGTCVVLYYHAVRAEYRERFASQMNVLQHHTHPIHAHTNLELQSGVHHVVLTFHDAFVGVFENALPELARRGIPSTVFVPSGFLGRRPGWIKDQSHSDYGEMVIDEDTLRSVDSKLVTVGSHTVSHPDLTVLDGLAAKEELFRSKMELEMIVGRPVSLFAFPFGKFTEALTELSKDVGYQRVFTTEPNLAFSTPDEYVTGSCPVSPADWNLEFKLKLMGGYRWLPPVYRFKRKLVSMIRALFSHSAPENPVLRTEVSAQNRPSEEQDPTRRRSPN